MTQLEPAPQRSIGVLFVCHHGHNSTSRAKEFKAYLDEHRPHQYHVESMADENSDAYNEVNPEAHRYTSSALAKFEHVIPLYDDVANYIRPHIKGYMYENVPGLTFNTKSKNLKLVKGQDWKKTLLDKIEQHKVK